MRAPKTGDMWVCAQCFLASHVGAQPDKKGVWYTGEAGDIPCAREPLQLLSRHVIVKPGVGHRLHDPERCEGCGDGHGGERFRLIVFTVLSDNDTPTRGDAGNG